MTDTVSAVAFWLLAAASVGGAVAMLSTRNVMHAAFWLLEVMLSIAGLFLLLSAEFLAMVQVMVYAGAVSVLMLFVVMLTLRRREDAVRSRDASLGAAVLAALVLGMLGIGFARFETAVVAMPESAPGIAEFGRVMFTQWALPFEVASVVLLVALVGSVWWAGGGDRR